MHPERRKAMTTACVYHPLYLAHRLPGHPECPERLERVMETLENAGVIKRLVFLEPTPATEAEIELVHTPAHRLRVQSGDYNITDKHLADAIAELTAQKVPAP